MVKIKELRQKKEEELKILLEENKVKLGQLKFELSRKKLKNVRQIRQLKRNIARILTLLELKKVKK